MTCSQIVLLFVTWILIGLSNKTQSQILGVCWNIRDTKGQATVDLLPSQLLSLTLSPLRFPVMTWELPFSLPNLTPPPKRVFCSLNVQRTRSAIFLPTSHFRHCPEWQLISSFLTTEASEFPPHWGEQTLPTFMSTCIRMWLSPEENLHWVNLLK